jgi:hypothetical protein
VPETKYSTLRLYCNAVTGLDLAAKLVDHERMDARDGRLDGVDSPHPRFGPDWSRRLAWGVALAAAALIVAIVVGAYRQPELLLNIMGLRYCG